MKIHRDDWEPILLISFLVFGGATIAFVLSWLLTSSDHCLWGAGIAFAGVVLTAVVGAKVA